MNTAYIERRDASSTDTAQGEATEIVRQSQLLQSSIGTVVAAEYMKAYGVGVAVIGRVLAGGPVRAEDHAALAEHEVRAVSEDTAGEYMPTLAARRPDGRHAPCI